MSAARGRVLLLLAAKCAAAADVPALTSHESWGWGTANWVRHQFHHNSGPGTQFEVADVNGDKLLDVVTSNKKGVHYFEQTRE